MADTKISALASLSGASAAGSDALPIADVSAATTKAITLTELVAAIFDVIGVGLDDLNDATVTTPVANETLVYNGSAFINAVLAKKTKGANYTFLGVNGSGTVGYLDPWSVPQNVNTQTGTTYTLVLTDAGKLVTCSNASSITLTVPPASSVAFPAGTVIDLAQYGAGQVTIAAGAGVTVQTSSTLKMRTQWSAASLVLSATADQWFLVGDLEPLGQSINAQTGTTYTLVIGDAEKLVTLSNGSAITMTVPTNASVAFPTGVHIDLAQIGAGQVTVAAAGGVTVNSTPTLKFRAQHSGATLVKTATNTWQLMGDLAAS
jgi:hypothetical protein